MVNESRWMEIRSTVLDSIISIIERVAAKYGYRLSRIGLRPDHLHLTLGCSIDMSPESIAVSFLNNCAYAIGMKRVFESGYYVGTIGEYDRGAVA